MLHIREPRSLRTPTMGSSLKLSDITARASGLEAFDGHEQIWLGEDEALGGEAKSQRHLCGDGVRQAGDIREYVRSGSEKKLADGYADRPGHEYGR
jgi:hypothetical protein